MSKQRPGVDEKGKPVRTITLDPKDTPQLVSPRGLHSVTSLKVVAETNASPRPLHIIRDTPSLTIGSGPDASIVIDDGHVSGRHCEARQYGRHLLIKDCGSTNGTVFNNEPRDEFHIEAGDTFSIGRTVLLAMDDAMAMARDAFDQILGDTNRESSDLLLRDVVAKVPPGQSPRHFVIAGGRRTEGMRLAQLIHETATRGSRPAITLEFPIPASAAQRDWIVETCRRTTAIAAIGPRQARTDPLFWEKLFHPSLLARVIMIVSSPSVARLELAKVPSLSFRDITLEPPQEISKWLDVWWKSQHHRLRWAHLTDRNQAAIAAECDRSPKELERAARYLASIAEDHPKWDRRTWESRAQVVGARLSTLHDWYQKLRISEPLLHEVRATWKTHR